MYFGAFTEILSVLLVYVCLCIKNHVALVVTIKAQFLYYLPRNEHPSNNGGQTCVASNIRILL